MKNFTAWQLTLFIAAVVFFYRLPDANSQSIPQQAINDALRNAPFLQAPDANLYGRPGNEPSGVFSLMKSTPVIVNSINERLISGNFSAMTDTIFVGDVPSDTLFVTGTFFNNGPILVFNDGVLIFANANATILGDIFVFQNGKLFADSSIINSPQQYFYQRSMIVANNGYVNISNSTFDFGGLSHSLAVVDQADIILTNITNIGFTTAGAYGNSSITVNGSNQAGEFIMTDSSSLSFSNAATIILWHHIPPGGVINVSYPPGANVPAYVFNDAQAGVAGIDYDVQVTNCTDVMWALMPENGSDVTVTGSALRAIGLWFTGTDTSVVSGLVNNSNYNSFTAPLSDRNLQLNTTSVQTWSIYLFDQAVMEMTGCIVGEVGTMGTSFITAQGIFCDGSGGYYWATDTSFNLAVNTTITGYIRSLGNSIVLLAYGSSTAGASATGNSVMVVTQSILPQEPVAYEHGTCWRIHINPPQNLFVDTIIDISGSAFIDQGPLGAPMDFGYYTMEYKPASSQQWLPVTSANTNEVHNSLLSQWDTQGLTPGNYQLRLNTWNNSSDSIDAVIQVTLLLSILGTEEEYNNSKSYAYPVPAKECVSIVSSLLLNGVSQIFIYDEIGRLLKQFLNIDVSKNGTFEIQTDNWNEGIYYAEILSGAKRSRVKIFITR